MNVSTNGRAWTWDAVLTGVVPPLITPLDDEGEPDPAAMAALVEHILGAGGTGLFVLGGCGEGAWLTSSQRRAVIRAAVAAAKGRVPVLAGVMLPGTAPTVEEVKAAAGAGAAAVVAGSPYYFAVDPGAQERHVHAVLAASDLPVLLYNIPAATHHVLAPEFVARLASEPRVLGIKDSAGDFHAFQRLLAIKQRRPDFRVLQGNEHLASASLLHGADGLVPGLGNVAPGLLVALVNAARRGDLETVRLLQAQVESLWTLHTHGHWLPALKAACAHRRIGNGRPAPPLLPVDAAARACIARVVDQYGIVPAECAAPAERGGAIVTV